MGLRLKLGLYVVSFVLGVLVTVNIVQVHSEREIYEAEMLARNRVLLEGLAISCVMPVANNEITTLDNYVHAFGEAANSLDLRYLAAIDYWGRVLAHTIESEYGKVYDDPFTQMAMAADESVSRMTTLNDESVMEIAVPVKSGLRWGTLKAGFTMAPVERRIAESRNRNIMVSVAVALGVAIIAFLGLSLLVVQPVVSMAEMARRFGGGDLAARIELRQKDEMGRLATQLNAMAQQIQDYTGSLERLVQERTAELALANTKLLGVNEQLDKLAKTDGLTGLFNRRHFMEQLDFEIRRGARSRRQFTLALLDVDNFKSYNDTNGHPAGDELLRRLATLLELNLRSIDLVARYGGEEFILLLLDTGPEEGYRTALKLQQAVASQPFPLEESQPKGKLTISIGVAFYPHDSRDGRTLIESADQALYRSKANGRNCVTRWSDMASG
jgi:diguanylate cyclase (GGDEF)-like protein